MDARHFDMLTRTLIPGGSPRGLLDMSATLLDAADMAAKSQRRRKHY